MIRNTALYSDDRMQRYLLARVWDEKKPIPLFVTKVSGEADGIFLELTNNIISNNLYNLGYGGYYLVSLCSGIYGKTEELSDEQTDRVIAEYASKASEIIISWGSLSKNALKDREKEVLKVLKQAKKKVLAVSDKNGRTNLHALTPSVRNAFFLFEVNVKNLLSAEKKL